MLKGKDPALCHPGCVHQPVTLPWRPLLTFYLLAPPTPRGIHHQSCGAEGKDCTSCPGSGDLNTMSNLGRCWQWCVGSGVT